MVVLLPRATDGLGRLESSLSLGKLDGWLSSLAQRRVEISLPRFKLTAEAELKDALSALGMPAAFIGGQADFSGITGNRDLVISAVVHKAFVEVEEKGTEAAAATGVVMARTSVAMAPTIFRADHPFLFLIRDNRNGTILFLGPLRDPERKLPPPVPVRGNWHRATHFFKITSLVKSWIELRFVLHNPSTLSSASSFCVFDRISVYKTSYVFLATRCALGSFVHSRSSGHDQTGGLLAPSLSLGVARIPGSCR